MEEAYLRVGKVLKYLGGNADSRCFVEGEGILSANLLIMCGVSEVKNNIVHIMGLCLQTSALNDKPHEINITLTVNTESDVDI